MLCRYRIHRICLTQEAAENSVCCVLTLHRLLRFLLSKCSEEDYMHLTVRQLGVGTFKDIISLTYDSKLVDALEIMARHKVSGLPIVSENGVAVDVYSRSDVIVSICDVCPSTF